MITDMRPYPDWDIVRDSGHPFALVVYYFDINSCVHGGWMGLLTYHTKTNQIKRPPHPSISLSYSFPLTPLNLQIPAGHIYSK
jgi:hypothetical protein